MTKTITPVDNTPSTPQTILASMWHKFVGHHVIDHVRTGMTVTNGGGLNANVALGSAWVQGIILETDATIVKALTDNATNYLYLQLSRNGALEPVDWNVVSNTTGIAPADSMLIATVVTSGGTIGTITDKRTVKPDNSTWITRALRYLSDNIINYIELKAPNGLLSNLTFVLPSADGIANQALKTDGSKNLSFGAIGGGVFKVATDNVNFISVSNTGNRFIDLFRYGFSTTTEANTQHAIDFRFKIKAILVHLLNTATSTTSTTLSFRDDGASIGAIVIGAGAVAGWYSQSGINAEVLAGSLCNILVNRGDSVGTVDIDSVIVVYET